MWSENWLLMQPADETAHLWRLDATQTVKGVGSLPPHALGEALT